MGANTSNQFGLSSPCPDLRNAKYFKQMSPAERKCKLRNLGDSGLLPEAYEKNCRELTSAERKHVESIAGDVVLPKIYKTRNIEHGLPFTLGSAIFIPEDYQIDRVTLLHEKFHVLTRTTNILAQPDIMDLIFNKWQFVPIQSDVAQKIIDHRAKNYIPLSNPDTDDLTAWPMFGTRLTANSLLVILLAYNKDNNLSYKKLHYVITADVIKFIENPRKNKDILNFYNRMRPICGEQNYHPFECLAHLYAQTK